MLRMAKATLREETGSPRLARAFAIFHAENPHVFIKLREIAIEAQRRGLSRFGIAALFERLRWVSQVETVGDPYRLNNNHRAFYARLLMQEEPSLRGLFSTRSGRTDPDYRTRVARRRPSRRGPVGEIPRDSPRVDGRLF